MANNLLKPKRGKVENLPKLAVEDGSLIFAYDTNSPTSTVLVDVGETRYELSAATAKKADDSNALGGSSLKNIVDKINNSTGSGSAFTGLDTTTNDKVKLTRANGATVQKTINNVSNASTAGVANKIGQNTVGSSVKPVYINAGVPAVVSSIPSTFVESQLINGVNLDALRTPGFYYTAGGNTCTQKPDGIDAFGLHVIQSAAGWFTQVLYASNEQERQFVRYYNAGTGKWDAWIEQNRLNTKTLSGYVAAPGNKANNVWRTDGNGNPYWGTINDGQISKLASTVTLGDGNNARIDQNGATYRQRIDIYDNATKDDAVFSFQQSEDSGQNYKNLFVIKDNGTVTASTFEGKLKGNADTASNASALSGSSLQNIVDKINNSTGSGNAFTGIDTTTNNKIKLTRANGGTVEKTINNVSNASTADYAKNSAISTNANYLKPNPSTRQANANLTVTGAGGIRTFKATGTMTDNKPPVGDAHIIHFDWDNTGGYDSQIAVQNVSGAISVRGMNSGTWGNWRNVLDEGNYTNYAAKKNAYNSASVSNATITLGRSDGSTGTSLTVNNVAHASTADLAKNSNALGGSSLKNITDKINSSIAANDAMHYMGTIGAAAQSPTITALPTTARNGDAYKVVTADTYASIAAEVGDLFIYSGAWTLIPSGDDGNVYIGDSKSSKFAAKSNNIVIAVGDQKVASAANITANAGTITALQSTMTQLKANQGTVTTLSGSKATFTTFNGRLYGTANTANNLNSRGLINAFASTVFPDVSGLSMSKHYADKTTGYPTSYGNVLTMYDGGAGQLYIGWSGDNPGTFVRHKRDTSEAWTGWHRFITSADALNSSSSAIGSTNNYFTAGATTAYVAAKTASVVGNYLPLSGGTMTGTAMIQWPDSGNWSNGNSGVTFPVKRGGLQWSGQSDGIQLYAEETANDNLELVLRFTDDNSNGLSIRNAGGGQTARIVASGGISGASLNVSGGLTGAQLNLTGSGLLLHRENSTGNGRIKWWKTYGTWTDYMSDTTNGSAPTGGKPSSFGDVTSWARRSIIENTGGYGWVWEASAETTVAASTLSPTPIMSLSSNNGNLKVKGTVTATTVNAYLNGNAKNADTVDGFHAIDSNSLTSSSVSGKIVLAKNITNYIDSLGLATTSQLEWIEF